MSWGQLAGAILIALCVGGSWAPPLQAQVNEEEPGRQAETEQQQAEPSPLPVRIIDGAVQIIEEDAASEARQRQQERAEQREQDALVTQRALEEANRRIADTAQLQTWIIGLGTLAIFLTLVVTVRANRAAWAAVDVTRDMGQAQVRAYISWSYARFGIGKSDNGSVAGLGFMPVIKNTGCSPAAITALYSHLLVKNCDEICIEFDVADCKCNNTLGGGEKFYLIERWLTLDEAISIFNEDTKCYLLGWGGYRTIFSQPGEADDTFTFCFEVSFRIFPERLTKDALVDNIVLTSRPNYRIAPKQ